MTEERKAELVAEMKACRGYDEESGHIEGDEIVSKALRELGFPELADVYDEEKRSWWYA